VKDRGRKGGSKRQKGESGEKRKEGEELKI
jgi:hypothetical protein